jgi:hypothetical protein
MTGRGAGSMPAIFSTSADDASIAGRGSISATLLATRGEGVDVDDRCGAAGWHAD